MYAFLDLETTGLDPKADDILEIGIILVEGTEEIASFTTPVAGDLSKMGQFVRDMHTANGLITDCTGSFASSVRAAESQACAFLHARGCQIGELTLAGNSVHFDLWFLLEHMPELARFFSHRIMDMTSVSLWAETLGVLRPPKAGVHRALTDAHESLALFRVYREIFKR